MLVITRKLDQSLIIDGNIEIGDKTEIGVRASIGYGAEIEGNLFVLDGEVISNWQVVSIINGLRWPPYQNPSLT